MSFISVDLLIYKMRAYIKILLFTLLSFKAIGQNTILLYPIYEKVLYVDNVPKYKAQCKGTYIDKIIYSENHIVISFRFASHELNSTEKESISLFAQNNPQAWVLNNSKKTTNKQYIFLEKLINIKADTSLIYYKTEDKQIVEFFNLNKREKGNEIDNITCQLVFYYPPTKWEKLFLLEVPDAQYDTDGKFNFYDIEIKYRKK